jgi:glycerol-3-phosphate dehydrogenase subunit B
MKFDDIIIGGGHSGLQRAIELQRSGRRCLVVCAGESSRRFREPGWSQRRERQAFERLGGTFLMGDSVTGGRFAGDRLEAVFTANHGASPFEAERFYLATGSFFSGGLVADHTHVFEPVFGLDVDYAGEHHADWVDPDFFAEQPFMRFGVFTDPEGHPLKDGRPIENLFAIGSVVSRR